jgi:hypothetical protein
MMFMILPLKIFDIFFYSVQISERFSRKYIKAKMIENASIRKLQPPEPEIMHQIQSYSPSIATWKSKQGTWCSPVVSPSACMQQGMLPWGILSVVLPT